jgi:hypothetical protein
MRITLLGHVVACAALVGPAAAADDVQFDAGTTYPTGTRCANVQAADLDGDGLVDMVATNWQSDSISVLLGDGLGGFGVATNYPSGDKPWWVAVGDLDLDGAADLAVACGFSDAVAVHYGIGDGTFEPRVLVGTGDYPRACTIGDLNNDGEPDIISANINGNDLSVLLGLGSRTFDVPISIPAGRKPGMVMLDDLDGDGFADLVSTIRQDDELWIWRNSTFGWVESPQVLPTGNGTYAMAAGDLNGDGVKDLVTSNLINNSFSVFIATAPLTYLPHVEYPSGGDQSATSDLADLDGDGDLDLSVAHLVTSNISMFLNDGNGNFTYYADLLDLARPASAMSADLNRDGAPDLMVASIGGARAEVLLNRSPLWARRGNVNRGAGTSVDVVSVNGSTGGVRREITLAVGEPFSVYVDVPPSRSSSLHAMFGWLKEPRRDTVVDLFDDLGLLVLPIAGTSLPGPLPKANWNLTGDTVRFGVPNRTAGPAPGTLFNLNLGAQRPMVITVQGVIEDDASRTSEGLSVTNSMTIFVE